MAIKKKEKTKVNRKEAEKNTKDLSCPEHPVFCFRYLTSNKRYNLSNSKEPLNKAKLFLLIKMEEMSHLTWQELFNRNHINGLESIPLSRLNFDADKELTLSKEVLYALADYFDVSLDYLVGRSDKPERR